MRVGIIQSSFIPWRGYFDFISSVDLFIFYDDIQFSKGSWRNRNKIKSRTGTRWITVPVLHRSLNQTIIDTTIDNKTDWRKQHLGIWHNAYQGAAFLGDVETLLDGLRNPQDTTISQLNIRLTRCICAYLGIQTPMMLSSELNVDGTKTDRIINMLGAVGGTTYLSGPSADSYLEKEKLRRAGIRLEYKSYVYDPYPQKWGAFEGAVSILDLIANCGDRSKELIGSRAPDTVIL